MLRCASATALALCALLVVGCNGDGERAATPTGISPATPTDTAAAYRGGIDSVDAAIAAVLANDVDALVGQMRYSQLACEPTPEPLSIPPFCDGAPAGSLVDAFPTASCEGAYHRPGVAEESMRRSVAARSDSQLYGVYLVAGSRAEESFYSHAMPVYQIVFSFAGPEHEQAWALFADDDGIVGLSGGCGETPPDYVSFWQLTEPAVAP